jgi:hypothetical protein
MTILCIDDEMDSKFSYEIGITTSDVREGGVLVTVDRVVYGDEESEVGKEEADDVNDKVDAVKDIVDPADEVPEAEVVESVSPTTISTSTSRSPFSSSTTTSASTSMFVFPFEVPELSSGQRKTP